jgi:K+-sensing histidine kinase KdpD
VNDRPRLIVRLALWIGWLAALVVATAVMIRARAQIEQAHVVLVYLLIVLGASVTGGRPLGFTLAALAFGAIDYWFQLPYNEIAVAKPLDWLVLIAFLVTAVVTTQLLARAHARQAEARARAAEVTRLAREVEHAEALRESAQFKDTLLASVSHDFRTPLTTVKALAEELVQTASPDAAAAIQPVAAGITEQADRLMQLVDNVLDLSRIRGGVLPVQPELNTAEDLFGAAVRNAKGVLAEHPIEYAIDWDAPALTGYFDFGHSLRALSNLLGNAAKYSPPTSSITIEVRRLDRWLAIAVGDRGNGVATGERERIFEAFYRPPDTAPDAGGAGLGLAIARQLAAAQGGTVRYEPRAGGGSMFVLQLPAEGPPAPFPVEDTGRGAEEALGEQAEGTASREASISSQRD